jgi:hypothetical protein
MRSVATLTFYSSDALFHHRFTFARIVVNFCILLSHLPIVVRTDTLLFSAVSKLSFNAP